MKTPLAKRDGSKYCEVHRDYDYAMEDYCNLKDHILKNLYARDTMIGSFKNVRNPHPDFRSHEEID